MAIGYRQQKFTDYEGFVEKFKPKKTTDDCYTPPAVYEVVKEWVLDRCPQVRDLEIIRPFKPGGDYKSEDYTGKVVIDNPPFSILAEIKRFYNATGVPYFLFAPHLTIFSSKYLLDFTAICAGVSIIYENGANVRTSFVSNLFGDLLAFTAPDLAEAIIAANKQESKALPSYKYPPNVMTTSRLNYLCDKGVAIEVRRDETEFIRRLDDQIPVGKSIFGNGFLISEQAERRFEIAERRAMEIAERRAQADYTWQLSEREKAIVSDLTERGKLSPQNE